MAHVERIDLVSLGVVLPADKVGVVISQPHLQLSDTEPYRCVDEYRERQLKVLSDTLAISIAAHHGLARTHFTIFPEYSIAGLDGIALIQTAIEEDNWPTATIIIGGVDALSKQEFLTLVGQPRSYLDQVHNSIDRIRGSEWVNCAIVWVKSSDGHVHRWLQPKLHPAWPEQDVNYQDMFCGRSVFTFTGLLESGSRYRFTSLVCFDWIAPVTGEKAWRWSIADLQLQATEAAAEIPLSWFFVIQHNPRPSHHAFLTEIRNFFDQSVLSDARRERTCLVFANTAGKHCPGRVNEYGSTSLIFTKQTLFTEPQSRPTFSNGGAHFRASHMLADYHDCFLREGGACVHSFAQVNPNSLIAGAAGRAVALERAFVFPLYEGSDPRAPSEAVPSCIKWLNDELDEISSLGDTYHNVPLATDVTAAHVSIVTMLRDVPAPDVVDAITLATSDTSEANPDEWGLAQRAALKHVVHTLEILNLAFSGTPNDASPAHGLLTVDERTVDLAAVYGVSHQACLEHTRKMTPRRRRQSLLVSRDPDNTGWNKRFGSYLEAGSPQLGADVDITDPSSASLHVAYQDLLEILQLSDSADDLKSRIYAKFN